MTNQEWLLTLKPNDCALFCLQYLPKIGSGCSMARYSVAMWLKQEYVGNIDYSINEFNEILKMEAILYNKGENNE